ncbi:interleukin-17 receptor A isoform X2 [Ambystoma mexicanum]|uniref:interleukin-17 receptor A isoform X2 n=1 Tax=Ambystoma mexicanum TaxID=8296 RepID=UPI0037E881D4
MGVQLLVLKMNGNEQLCVELVFENVLENQNRPDGKPWHFAYNHFIVDPGTTYEVTVHHLPKLDNIEGPNQKSLQYRVPGCSHNDMMMTRPCELQGSRWKPNIIVDVWQDSSLNVSFTSSNLASKYYINVIRCAPPQSICNEVVQHVLQQVEPQQRVNVSFFICDPCKIFCQHQVEIWGLFPSCSNDCIRHRVTVICPTSPPISTTTPGPTRRDHWYITASCALLVSLTTAGIIFMVLLPGPQTDKEPINSSKNLKNPKVWIVYSADHALYVDVVVKFADFLRTKCAADVVLDRLQTLEIEKVGFLPWLTRQKQEIEEQSGKIILLCSRGAQAKWQAMMDKPRVSLRQDLMHPSGDLFTAALNLIMHDFQFPANFGKYIIAYVGDISMEEDIPEPFKATSRYKLMDKFEDVFFRIHDLEQYEPGQMFTVEEITAHDYTQNASGQCLQAAICKFKKWQEVHPDWFLKECSEGYYDYGEEADMDFNVPSDPLLREGATIRFQPAYKMPKDSGCLFAELQLQEPSLVLTQIEPLPQCSNEYPAQQTIVYISDVGVDDLGQRQEPGFSGECVKTARQQLPCMPDWLDGLPFPQARSDIRSDLLSNNDLRQQTVGGSQDSQHWSLPGADDLSDEQKRNLEHLKHFQQYIALSGQFPLEGEQQQLVENSPEKAFDERRQTLCSDQGYSSRTASPPLEPSGEDVGSVGWKSETSDPGISAQDLELVKKIQSQLFIQSSGWGIMGPI